jgi:thiamine-monophosphate kinase
MSLGEFDIIAKYFAGHAHGAEVLLGIGDDAAVYGVRADRRLVLAMDTIVEGVHFLPDADAADIGYRALAVNLSDLAAMGAVPSWMSLSLSLPRADEQWLSGFAAGLFELARRYDVQLIGGDTVKGPLVITVQVGGWVEPDCWLERSGAREGDAIFVSGTLGDAAAGLALLTDGQRPMQDASFQFLRNRFLRPEPRIALGRALRSVATAAMDISDGLLSDLGKLCEASRCGALLEVEAVPVSQPLQTTFDVDARIQHSLCGGDDYELLFTAPPAAISALEADAAITQIGVITSGSGVECRRAGQPFTAQRTGYDHFAH